MRPELAFVMLGLAGVGLGVAACRGDTTINANREGSGDAAGQSNGVGAASNGGSNASHAGKSGGGQSTTGGDMAQGGEGATGATGGGTGCGTGHECSELCHDCDDDPNDCETAVNSKAQCGACERSCSACEPTQAACTGKSIADTVIADVSKVNTQPSVAIGGDWLYFERDYAGYRVSISNAGAPAKLAMSGATGFWRGIATDSMYAYFVNPGGVFRVKHSGSTTAELIGTFDGGTPVATMSPVVVNKVLYFAVAAGTPGPEFSGSIDSWSVHTLEVPGTAASPTVPVADLSFSQFQNLDSLFGRYPSVAANANGTAYLCLPTAPGLIAAGDQILGDEDEGCAGVTVVGSTVYYRSLVINPAPSGKGDMGLTQLYKLSGPNLTTRTALGPQHHSAQGMTLVNVDDTALYFCGYDAADTLPGLGAMAYPWVAFHWSLAGSVSTRLGASGSAGTGVGYDCSDLAVDPGGSGVYLAIDRTIVRVPDLE